MSLDSSNQTKYNYQVLSLVPNWLIHTLTMEKGWTTIAGVICVGNMRYIIFPCGLLHLYTAQLYGIL